MLFKIALCLYFLSKSVLSQVVQDGRCPDLQAVQNFNMNAYLGTWWGIGSYPEEYQDGGECAWAEFTVLDGGDFYLRNNMVQGDYLIYVDGNVQQIGTDGVLNVTFDYGGQSSSSTQRIIATDYEDYSVVYNCFDLEDGQRRVFALLLSRNETWSEESRKIVDYLFETIEGLDYGLVNFSATDADSCYYENEMKLGDGWLTKY